MFKSKQRIYLNCKDSSITSTLLITLSDKFDIKFLSYNIEKYAK